MPPLRTSRRPVSTSTVPRATTDGGAEAARLAAAEDGVHPGHQLPGREGLSHVVISPELEAEHPIHFVVSGAEDQYGDSSRSLGRRSAGPGTPGPPVTGPELVAPQPPADVEPVQLPGKSDVQDDQLGALPGHQGQPGLAVIGLQHPESVTTEVHRHKVRNVMVVLDHHQRVFVGHHLPSLPPENHAGGSWLGKCEARAQAPACCPADPRRPSAEPPRGLSFGSAGPGWDAAARLGTAVVSTFPPATPRPVRRPPEVDGSRPADQPIRRRTPWVSGWATEDRW